MKRSTLGGAHTDQQLIDVHAHFLTEPYAIAARAAGHVHPDGMAGWPKWSADEHLRLMDRWGVATAMLSISSPGTYFGDDASARRITREVNEAGAAISRAHPGRFGHFASLPLPDVAGALDELDYALDGLGSDGIIVETNSAGVYLGDDRFEPPYRELDRRRAVVFVHPTSPPCAETTALGRPRPMLEFVFDLTRTVSHIVFTGTLLRHPDIEWVFTHGGGALPLLAERMELFRALLLGEDDPHHMVPRQLRRFWFDIAGTPFLHQVPAAVAAFGTERLLYGSDYCWTPPHGVDAQLASIEQADQPADDSWRALTTRNAIRLLGARETARQGACDRLPTLPVRQRWLALNFADDL